MSCETNPNRATRPAGQSGINSTAGKSGYIAGSTAQVSFFALAGNQPPDRADSGQPTGQASFFRMARSAAGAGSQQAAADKKPEKLPTGRRIYLNREFTPEELDRLTVQLLLGGAAARRQVKELKGGRSRGIGHSDPRPLDWARSDQRQYQFLTDQLRRAKRGQGYIDTSGLKKKELVGLWEFARFEADRAHRNIDHLTSGLSHIKGPTADYLVGGHKLEARFYSHLAGRLEAVIPPEALARETW